MPTTTPGSDDPTVYLSHNMMGQGQNAIMIKDPTVYLAMQPDDLRAPRHLKQPEVYLAHRPLSPADNPLVQDARAGSQLIDVEDAPPLLLSFVYVAAFIKDQPRYRYRHWCLDSGAFSAHNMGKTIVLEEYTAFCAERLAVDPTLREVFGLDVIGDWRASIKNVEAMWRAGVPAIPTFHVGEPEDVLVSLARDYPKIALGGMVGRRKEFKREWAARCITKVWPKRVHGFGIGGTAMILSLPWHSVDATNWESGPSRFGRWNTYGNLPIRGSLHDLRVEILHFKRLEQQARDKWRAEMAQLEAHEPYDGRVMPGSGGQR